VPFKFTENKLTNTRIGIDRTYLNGSRDIHEESLAFQKNVRDIYVRVALRDESLALVDCSSKTGTMLGPDKIFDMIVKIIKARKLI
jgi:dTMP kinase